MLSGEMFIIWDVLNIIALVRAFYIVIMEMAVCDLRGFTQGKYGRRLYCDHVTKCFVSKCVIQVVYVLLCSNILSFH